MKISAFAGGALILAMTLAIVPAGAQAASDAEEFERAGMFGEWAKDCSQPPSPNNPHYLTQGASDGSVVDSGWANTNQPAVIAIASFSRRLPDNRLEYVSQYRQPATIAPLRIVVVIEGNRRRIMESAGLNGEVLVRQGKLKDGNDTPWFHRCVPGTL